MSLTQSHHVPQTLKAKNSTDEHSKNIYIITQFTGMIIKERTTLVGVNTIVNKLQTDLLSLSARHKAGGYRRARRFPDDRQMALFLRGVERDEGA